MCGRRGSVNSFFLNLKKYCVFETGFNGRKVWLPTVSKGPLKAPRRFVVLSSSYDSKEIKKGFVVVGWIWGFH